jgi:protoheme IX farnesyltransferase
MRVCASNAPTAMLKHKLRDFFLLTKPTITLLVVVTVLPSLLLASPSMPTSLLMLWTLLGTMLLSSSAAVFNQVLEEGVDQNMERTRSRSLPSGRVSSSAAIAFGFSLGFLGTVILYFGSHPLAAWIAVLGHLFYALFYTLWLKKKTPQNIVIGGIAGAVGPLIGCAAVAGQVHWYAWVLFLIIILWTPPHFWALALKYKEDYERAKIPMYPNIYGDDRTRKAMMFYSISLIPFVLSFFFFNKAGYLYLCVGSFFAIKFAWDSYKIYRSKNNDKVMPFFYFSCTYTFAIFLALSLDRLIVLLRA